jgi:hypothetical protein
VNVVADVLRTIARAIFLFAFIYGKADYETMLRLQVGSRLEAPNSRVKTSKI